MNKLFFFPFLLFFATTYADPIDNNSWSVLENAPPFAYTSEFEINKGNTSFGKVVRTGLFTPHYYYDLYDADHSLQVRGVTRAFSLGSLWDWGTEIDLYDQDRFIGMIKGRIWTSSRAKFTFYDANSEATAHAYLSDNSRNFLIVSAQNSKQAIAELNGEAYGDASVWEIKPINYPLNVDERALLIFAGFVADFKTSFAPPRRRFHFSIRET